MIFYRISHNIIYEDMPQVEALLNICRAIDLCREGTDRDDLPLEEELVKLLFMLYRSPDALITWTELELLQPIAPPAAEEGQQAPEMVQEAEDFVTASGAPDGFIGSSDVA